MALIFATHKRGEQATMAKCRVKSCDKEGKPNARGMCWGHYLRWYRYGHPLASAPSKQKSA